LEKKLNNNMNKSLDISKFAAKLTSNLWMLPPVNHSLLCKLVESYMEHGYQPEPALPEGIVTQDGDHPREMDDTEMIDSTCIIKVCGILSKGVSELEELLLGLADLDEVSYALDQAAADSSVKDIVIAFSSPGGETLFVEETGRKIKFIDENIKPVYSWCESQSTSAAFWLMSQTRKIGMIPSAQVGGVGVYSLVENITGAMKQAGTDVEVFSAGEFKMLGHPFRNMTDEERKILQSDVDKQFVMFKEVVMAKRPQIKEEDLNGLSYEGRDALAKGFADIVVDSFNEFLLKINE
jgi:signal peptide peptidase SppA